MNCEHSDEQMLADAERRVEELRRVNAGLARDLAAAGTFVTPRSPAAAARLLARLSHERDAAVAERDAAQGELDWLRPENEALRSEVQRLRSGFLGLLRRTRARLLRF